MKADLHVHSTASDGTLAPAAVVDRAHANGVTVLALADHDSVAGLPQAADRAAALGVQLINACELSAVWGSCDIHILAYFVDPENSDLLDLLGALRSGRLERARAMVAALSAAGYSVAIDDVLDIACGGSLGRSHVARALVQAGHASTVKEAFENLIGRDRPFYVPKHSATPGEVIATIRELGAIPVLAHPGVTGADPLIADMVDAGLLGVEAYHADHTAEQVAHYASLAARLGLLVTGGSDFHGPGAPNPDIGVGGLPEERVAELLARGGLRQA
jgi:predicted metal-dependent phosphoesterase TrpH